MAGVRAGAGHAATTVRTGRNGAQPACVVAARAWGEELKSATACLRAQRLAVATPGGRALAAGVAPACHACARETGRGRCGSGKRRAGGSSEVGQLLGWGAGAGWPQRGVQGAACLGCVCVCVCLCVSVCLCLCAHSRAFAGTLGQVCKQVAGPALVGHEQGARRAAHGTCRPPSRMLAFEGAKGCGAGRPLWVGATLCISSGCPVSWQGAPPTVQRWGQGAGARCHRLVVWDEEALRRQGLAGASRAEAGGARRAAWAVMPAHGRVAASLPPAAARRTGGKGGGVKSVRMRGGCAANAARAPSARHARMRPGQGGAGAAMWHTRALSGDHPRSGPPRLRWLRSGRKPDGSGA